MYMQGVAVLIRHSECYVRHIRHRLPLLTMLVTVTYVNYITIAAWQLRKKVPDTNLALCFHHKENIWMSEFQQNVRRNVYTHHVLV